MLSADDRICDGFVDYVSESVAVERGGDERLEQFLYKAQSKLQKSSDPVTTLMAMALFVSECCGRSGTHAADLPKRFEQRVRESKQPDGRLPLGCLLGDQAKKNKKLGAGLVRHRALVFKLLADVHGLALCTLERDVKRKIAWNTVQVGGTGYVVDLMHDTGTLYEAGSPKQQEYLKLIDPSMSSAVMETISMRFDLSGHVPRPAWHVEPGDIEIGSGSKDTLGKGGFGEVFLGRWAGIKVAVKVVKDKDPTDYDILDFVLEIAVVSRLSHPNVMRFWRGCADMMGKRSLLMVTEYIAKGGLSGLLHGHGGPAMSTPFTLPQSIWMSLGMARGMQYLHGCKVLHLDLKSPNVLVESNWMPKLCDFGLAKISQKETEAGYQTTLRGVSPIWAPPEMFDDQAEGMTDRADVYSYGIVFFETISRKLPFSEIPQRQLPKAKWEGVLPQVPQEMPKDCADLVLSCCCAKPSSRPSMSGVAARIQDMASSRDIDLDAVEMPSWQQERAAVADAGAESRAGDRTKRLQEEKARLLQQYEQARERRRKVQEVHLGKEMSVPNLALLEAPPENAVAKNGKSKDSAEPAAGTSVTDPPEKKCCILL